MPDELDDDPVGILEWPAGKPLPEPRAPVTPPTPARSVVERVLYVDAGGNVHEARTLERARRDERIRLLTKIGPTLTVVQARYSAHCAGGTWHYAPKPD
jgi:hypothetical protein